MKSHKDFVVYVKNGVEINALVAISHPVTFPATQDRPAVTVEHLTLVYLEPGTENQRPSGDQLRNSVKTAFDVPPLTEGLNFGWKDVVGHTVQQVSIPDEAQGSGSERYAGAQDWTQHGRLADGWPVYPAEGGIGATPSSPVVEGAKVKQGEVGSDGLTDAERINSSVSGPDNMTDEQRGYKWGSPEHIRSIGGAGGPADAEFVQSDPELMKEFNDGREGKGGTPYTEALEENADHAKNAPFPSGDGNAESGHGPNPPESNPTNALDNPAPPSPKDPSTEPGPTVGE
jgi:hypothetical protein